MWLDRVSNPGALALKSDALPTAPRVPVMAHEVNRYENGKKEYMCCA